jgi:hypothetical protein
MATSVSAYCSSISSGGALPPGVEAGFATRHERLPQKGEKDLAMGEAFDRHGGDKTLQTQAPQHGEMAPPIDGLRRLCPLAPRRAGVKACQRLMAAGFVEKD